MDLEFLLQQRATGAPDDDAPVAAGAEYTRLDLHRRRGVARAAQRDLRLQSVLRDANPGITVRFLTDGKRAPLRRRPVVA